MTSLLLDSLAFPESPRWHEERLWFSDMHAHEIVAVEKMATEQEAIACMLGGADGKTLFILTSDGIDPDTCRALRTARILTHRAPSARAGRP